MLCTYSTGVELAELAELKQALPITSLYKRGGMLIASSEFRGFGSGDKIMSVETK